MLEETRGTRGNEQPQPEALERNPQLSLATRGEDWASQGQPKGKAEIPVVTRESRRIKNLTAVQETWVQSLGWKDPLEQEMATHSSILAWRIPWTEEADGL